MKKIFRKLIISVKHIGSRIRYILKSSFFVQLRYILVYINNNHISGFENKDGFKFNLYSDIAEIPEDSKESFHKTMSLFFKKSDHYLKLFRTGNKILLVTKKGHIAHFEFVNYNYKHIYPPVGFGEKDYMYIWEVHTNPEYKGNDLYIKSLKYISTAYKEKKLLLTTLLSNKTALKRVRTFGFKTVGILVFIKFFKNNIWKALLFHSFRTSNDLDNIWIL